MKKNNKNITVPGFFFAGINCGIKEKKEKKDLGLIYSEPKNTNCVGLFTKNQIVAAPVKICQKHLKTGKTNLVLINSGNANAATGKKGLQDANKITASLARYFNMKNSSALMCSTGKIGEPLPVTKIVSHLSKLKTNLSPQKFDDCAKAILTTDAYTKTAFYKSQLGKKPFHLAIMAKGAGMIEPNMATMLCFIMTDLKLTKPLMKKLLKEACSETLNALTVDGDMSTNDTVLFMANGISQNTTIRSGSKEYNLILNILTELLTDISIMIAQDGEGATKCLCVSVTGAQNKTTAKNIAKSIAKSQLFKSAMYGNDPNWGRILCAAGYAGEKLKEGKTTVSIGPHKVFHKGNPVKKNEKNASGYLKKNSIVGVNINIGTGKSCARVFASDLTPKYVIFNACYRT